jgi:hypothetical protein
MFIATPHDPFEPPDRRWLRAGYLVECGQPPSPRHDDAWVERAVAYRRALAACRDDEERLRLAERVPAVAQAHALRLADPPLLRWAVEGRVLAREPFDVIAKKCALLPEAVEAYERLFFSVADKLDAVTWVTCRVIGPKIHHGLAEQDLDVWWRFVGYTYGPVVLDAVLHNALGQPYPATAGQVAGVLARDAEALFSRKKLLATHLLPVTPETAAQVLQLAAQLGAAGRGEAPGRGGRGPLGAEVDRLLAAPSAGQPPGPRRADDPTVEKRSTPPSPAGAAPLALPAPAGLLEVLPVAVGREVA